MTRIFGLLALLVAFGNAACAEDPPAHAHPEKGRTPFAGYHAEVELSVGGAIHHGRVIITGDGCVHFEHGDEPTRHWATEVIRRATFPTRGWDGRTEPVRTARCGLGRDAALAEIQMPNASIKMTRHQLLVSK